MKRASRNIGLIIVSLVAAFYLFIIVAGFFEADTHSFDLESLGMVILSIATGISVIVAWVKTRLGAWLVLGVGVLFAIFGLITAGHHHWMAVMAAGGPLIIGSGLILLGLERKQ